MFVKYLGIHIITANNTFSLRSWTKGLFWLHLLKYFNVVWKYGSIYIYYSYRQQNQQRLPPRIEIRNDKKNPLHTHTKSFTYSTDYDNC